jgi:PncC family amidohydrolase
MNASFPLLTIQTRRTVAVAESVTGGLLASSFIDERGASSYFLGGVVAYSNESKISILGIDRNMVERCNGVSEEVAEEMAINVAAKFGADIGVSVTGYAEKYGEHEPQAYFCLFIDGIARTYKIRMLGETLLDRNKCRKTIVDDIRDMLSEFEE